MNGILLVDKPAGWTSHDVVAKLRGMTRERRIGHSGTLDPMATGLLVVFLGRATRAVEFAEAHEKAYMAALRLGVETDTLDITGTVLTSREVHITRAELEAVLPRFRGEIWQLPPMYSAIKIKGKKLYEIARAGGCVERERRRVTIFRLECVGELDGDFLLEVVCSKGTYIRSLCADIGAALGCGGCMSALRRTRAGAFSVAEAYSLESLEREGVESRLLPVDSLFKDLPALSVEKRAERLVRNGTDVPMEGVADGLFRVYGADGGFLMLGRGESGVLKTVKSFFEVDSESAGGQR